MYVVYNVESVRIAKNCETLAGAKRSALALNKKTLKVNKVFLSVYIDD